MILGPLRHLVLVGAHCDDIAIGAGATVRAICQANPGLRVSALVLTGAGTVREDEERAALAACCPGADMSLTVAGLPDNRLPAVLTEEQAEARLTAGAGAGVRAGRAADREQPGRALASLLADGLIATDDGGTTFRLP